MYSRSRFPPSEERYKNSIPPLYSGNRFQNVRRERTSPVMHEEQMPPEPPVQEPFWEEVPAKSADAAEDAEAAEAAEEKQPETALSAPEEKPPGILGLSREDLLLLGILLLLSAEHEHSMDVIVVLLLLLGIR